MKTKETKILKKIGLIMMLAAAFALCACGSQSGTSEDGAETPNPVHEVKSSQKLVEKTGISLEAPEGAENVTYSYIDGEDGAEPMAQVMFTVDGTEYTYRCMSTAKVKLDEYLEGTQYEGQDVAEAIMNGAEVGTDISGMYCQWTAAALTEVNGREGVCAINDGKEGVVIWNDVVPGFMYSLSVSDNADQDTLLDMAETIFVPMQTEEG